MKYSHIWCIFLRWLTFILAFLYVLNSPIFKADSAAKVGAKYLLQATMTNFQHFRWRHVNRVLPFEVVSHPWRTIHPVGYCGENFGDKKPCFLPGVRVKSHKWFVKTRTCINPRVGRLCNDSNSFFASRGRSNRRWTSWATASKSSPLAKYCSCGRCTRTNDRSGRFPLICTSCSRTCC
jgi:hypothetical protein